MDYAPAVRKGVHVLVTVLVLLYIITGFGITDYRAVEPLTLGLLTKALSQQIHRALAAPFIIVLALHIYFTLTQKK